MSKDGKSQKILFSCSRGVDKLYLQEWAELNTEIFRMLIIHKKLNKI